MVRTTKAQSARRTTAGLVAGVVFSSALALAAFPGSAAAEERRDEHRDHREHRQNWNGGYYPSPPVVFNAPYYYAPPVVYGPGIGLNFNIR